MNEKPDNEIENFRILTIDGGGIKGIVPLSFLADIEEDLENPIGKYFDLIVGTSTGGIIAAGLALGYPAEKILKDYKLHCPSIFNPNYQFADKWWKSIWQKIKRFTYVNLLRHPKYESINLEKALDSILGDAYIGQAITRLMIPTWDQDQRKVYIYKTSHYTPNATDFRKPMKDALLATSAAPLYFPSHKTIDHVQLIDGSIWANNPVSIAAVEATKILNWDSSNIKILSLGCTEDVYMLREKLGYIDVLKFGRSMMFGGQSECALNIAKILLGHEPDNKKIFRISPEVPINYFKLNDTTKIDKLSGIGVSSARREKNELIPIFFNEIAKPFTPLRKLEQNKKNWKYCR